MDAFTAFARGPLFKLSFSIMVLGLLRIAVLSIWGMAGAVRRAGDKNVPYAKLFSETLGWLVPLRNLFSSRKVFSLVSFAFHLGAVFVPLFLLDHILLWKSGLGLHWPNIGKGLADALTLLTLCTGLVLLLNRILHPETRFLSGVLDYVILLTILGIFCSGFIASRPYNPVPYRTAMLVHVLCGDLLFLLFPFTKLAHCMLYPLLRLAGNIAWRFPPRAGEAVNKTLYGEEIRKI